MSVVCKVPVCGVLLEQSQWTEVRTDLERRVMAIRRSGNWPCRKCRADTLRDVPERAAGLRLSGAEAQTPQDTDLHLPLQLYVPSFLSNHSFAP